MEGIIKGTTMLSTLRESQLPRDPLANCDSTTHYKGASTDITVGLTKEFPVGGCVASVMRVMPRETKVLCAPYLHALPCMSSLFD